MDTANTSLHLDCDAILFDMDGVLIDSTMSIIRHWKHWAALHNINFEEILAVAHGRRSIETIRLVAPHLNAEKENLWFAEHEAGDTEGIITIPGASDLLLSVPGHAWAIATSATRPLAVNRLEHARLPIPDVIVTADDVTYGKPHPEPYLTAANQLNVNPEDCVVIEDSPAGIRSALDAGMRVVAVVSTHSPQELAEATIIAPSLKSVHCSPGTEHVCQIRVDKPIFKSN